jgi:hypothetical protein
MVIVPIADSTEFAGSQVITQFACAPVASPESSLGIKRTVHAVRRAPSRLGCR